MLLTKDERTMLTRLHELQAMTGEQLANERKAAEIRYAAEDPDKAASAKKFIDLFFNEAEKGVRK